MDSLGFGDVVRCDRGLTNRRSCSTRRWGCGRRPRRRARIPWPGAPSGSGRARCLWPPARSAGPGAADAAAGAVDVEADPLASVLELEVEQLHHGHVGRAVVDDALQEDDAVLEQEVAQRHLPLPRVVAIALEPRLGEMVFETHER